MKIRPDINLEELCTGFIDKETHYYLEDGWGEFIAINKSSREISSYGYTGLIQEWIYSGIIDDIIQRGEVVVRNLNQSKDWVTELNEWREDNKETLLELSHSDYNAMFLNWMMDKLDEQESLLKGDGIK